MSTLAAKEKLGQAKLKIAKAQDALKKAKGRKDSESRQQELKTQFVSWMKEYQQDAQKARSLSPQNFEYDTDAPGDVTKDAPHIMISKSAKTYGKMEEEVRQFQQFNDNLIIAALTLSSNQEYCAKRGVEKVSPVTLRSYQEFRKGTSELAKALATSLTGYGTEWAPTGFLSSDFIERVENEFQLVNLHRRVSIPQGVKVLDIGGAGGRATVSLVSESTHDESAKIPASTPGTRKVTLTPVKFAARTFASTEQEEDSAIAVASFLRDELISAYAYAVEDCIINGDTTATHQDSNVTSAADHRKGWKGYRKLAASAAKVDCDDVVNISNFRKARQNMVKYGRPQMTFAVVGATGMAKLSVLPECITLDKYGASAAILTGEVGNVLGTRIIWSDLIQEDLNASGVYDGSTTNRTVIPIVYRPGFMSGIKREVTLKSEEDIETDQVKLVVTGRICFEARYATTEPIVGLLYDISSAT